MATHRLSTLFLVEYIAENWQYTERFGDECLTIWSVCHTHFELEPAVPKGEQINSCVQRLGPIVEEEWFNQRLE